MKPSVLYARSSVPAMQNRLYATRQEALKAAVGQLELVFDTTAGYVTNRAFDQRLMVYDETYQNEQGVSPRFATHLRGVAQMLGELVPRDGSVVVEVGCGKGTFVELLREGGWEAFGYDPAYAGNRPYIRKQVFDRGTHAPGDLVVLRHVLEHVPAPWEFIAAIARANAHRGLLYVEVPTLEWILETESFFDLFHEHVNYFCPDDFTRRFGTAVKALEPLFEGQYLGVVIDLSIAPLAQPVSPSKEPKHLQAQFYALKTAEAKVYEGLMAFNRVVIWGAAAKGVTFATRCPAEMLPKLAYAIDINPAKQGRYMPVTGIPVLGPAEALQNLSRETAILVLNPAYRAEVAAALPEGQPLFTLGQRAED